MQTRLVILLLFLVWQLSPAQIGLSDEVIENIEKRVAADLNPSIAVGIIDSTGMRFYSFGTTTIGGNAVNEHTIYEIGSITKTFTGTLLAELSIAGVVGIDDAVNKYLPENVQLPERNGDQITLGHLSDHTSSLPRMPSNFNPANQADPYVDYDKKLLYEYLATVELTRDIGSKYEYSNLAQGLLGQILADQSGKSYEELMIEKIAAPLEMTETKITLDDNMRSHLAIGHSNGTEVENWNFLAIAGAGAIRSSTSDMLKYVGANLGLIPSNLEEAFALAQYPRHDKAGGEYVGLGWHIKPGDNGDIIWHNGGTGGYRAFTGFIKEASRGIIILTNSTESIDDLGIYLLDPSSPLTEIHPRVSTEVRNTIDSSGIEAGIVRYHEIKNSKTEQFEFNENDMNLLGYHYLSNDQIDEALAVFKLNVEEYPESFNVYDSYGEALKENGQHDMAIENYQKSLELNPGNTGGIEMLEKLGVKYVAKEIKLDGDILEKYVGTYQLTPQFNIVVTREGNQIFGQATGQGQFEMFATSETDFYLKVVAAKVIFTVNDSGEAESLTLFQGGQELPGKKIK
jgi:CubicO group peptidase (beta-lactamase class C family)